MSSGTPAEHQDGSIKKMSTREKSQRTTLIAVIVVVLLGSFAIWDGSKAKKEEAKKAQDLLLIPYMAEEVTGLEIINKINRVELKKITDSKDAAVSAGASDAPVSVGSWVMLSPIHDQADSLMIQTMLTSFQTQKSHETVVEGADIQWSVYGLDHPVTTLKVIAGGQTTTLQIGSIKAYNSDLYARVDQQNRVLLVGSDWDENLSRLPREFRDKRLIRVGEDVEFSRVEVESAASGKLPAHRLVFVQKDRKWTAQQNPRGAANKASKDSGSGSETLSEMPVISFIEQIKSARALDFLDDDKGAPGVLNKDGLLKPATTVRLFPEAKVGAEKKVPAPIVLSFAALEKGKANVAAVSSELKPVLSVYSSFVEGLKKPLTDFFDKLAPFHFKASDVTRVRIQTKGSLSQFPLNLELAKQGENWVVATNGLHKQIDSGKLNEMIKRIGELEAVRFIHPLPKSEKMSDNKSDQMNNKMSNRIELLRADGAKVFDLQWGDLISEKKDVKLPGESAPELPGQVEAQFLAASTSQSKWLLGIPEGSVKDLGLNAAISDIVKVPAASASPAPASGKIRVEDTVQKGSKK